MLRKAKELNGYKLSARDGEIGNVKDFYFDDQSWTIRYLVAETGGWLSSRQVLISPYALHAADDTAGAVPVELTKEQIENSPDLASDKPVSRQYEIQYYSYYGWPMYWNGPYAWGSTDYPTRGGGRWTQPPRGQDAGDPHLRSTGDVAGHHIGAEDGEIGHVEDFLIDDETWTIRYLVVDTRNWWPGKQVLISPQWIERVSWRDEKVFINLPRETIKRAPEYTGESPVTRDYETALYGHYNRETYWGEYAAKNTTAEGEHIGNAD